MGGAVNFVENLVNKAVDVVTENPELAIAALPFIGPEALALDAAATEGLGGVGAFDVASSAIPGLTFDAATGEYLLADSGLGGLGSTLESLGSGNILNGDLTDIVNTGDTFGSSTEQDIFGGTTNTGDTFGSSTAGEIESSGGFTNWEDYIKNLPSSTQSINTGGILDALSKLGSTVANTPSIPATLYAGLALADQRRINNQIMNAYNIYQADKLRKKQQYQTGESLPSLPTTVGGVPLAQAQPRTAAQTVVRAAKGGSIHDLYNEYSELNNRMRNYRRLAKGGII